MTAEREEALRLLRMAERDQRAFDVLLAAGSPDDFPAGIEWITDLLGSRR